MKINNFASAVLIEQNGKLLAVSRKEDSTSWGFPGGKAEPNEEAITTANREFVEEVGVPVFNLRKIHEAPHFDFFVTLFSGEISSSVEEHINSDGCTVAWVEPSELCKGAFSAFNKSVLSLFGYNVK